mmetsp:Transcript_15232/g.20793  ORF Transcript_15232/g.20793 Transcript_15232/m.20793 type:complete len:270 (-) Transcript_15232:587-1396(-)|eukprot:CAMPEP_0185723340 /NCGR_PEP_ID=MMETSP1171-20130828/214_1 /TAXON_ID=374046 /ORGANISM="Helicotheca tamensis, Strain CCMP826" /LENGTH=269 /DNA_ID=CAMNT_0028391029 /DNA_START=131 /DNA_END=940 /DNA_ORIENTATION=-
MLPGSSDSEDPSNLDKISSSEDPGFNSFALGGEQESDSLDMKYFWIVNCIIVVAIIAVVAWCFRKRGSALVELVTRWSHVTGRNSDYVYAARVARRLQAEKEAKKESPEERKARLLKCFETNGVVMVINEKSFVGNTPTDEESGEGNKQSDIVENPDNDNYMDEISMDDVSTNGQPVVIPTDAKNGNRTVPNCCAICLCPYDIGDELVWSSNEACSHAFHSECIVDWLIKMQEGTPCPCCRQDFTNLPERSNEVKKDPIRTFDLQAISV